MTQILLTTLADALGGAVPADATLTATATRPRTDGDTVTDNTPVTVQLTDGVPAEAVELDPSGPDWCWHLRLQMPAGRIDRWVVVPAVGPVEWGDLVDIDPGTLSPVATPEPAWWLANAAAVVSGEVVGGELVLARNDGSTFSAGQVGGGGGDPVGVVSHPAREGVAVLLTGWQPPTILRWPHSVTVRVGEPWELVAAAVGLPDPTAQWSRSADGEAWEAVPGGTGATLSGVADQVGETIYRAVFVNPYGSQETYWVAVTVTN